MQRIIIFPAELLAGLVLFSEICLLKAVNAPEAYQIKSENTAAHGT